MSAWSDQLKASPLPWLLEPDPENPGIRYFALRDLLNRPQTHPEMMAAQGDVMASGPVPVILAAQEPDGYWVKPEAVYGPKYRGTAWQVIFLAQLGADGHDERVRRGAEYALNRVQASNGTFSYTGAPSGAIHCIWGNMVRALLELGYGGDERLDRAIDLLARSVTGDGYERYYRSGIQGPGFLCSANYGLPCGWGAVRVLWGLNAVPSAERTPAVEAAITACLDFLLSYDIARADYPHQERINSSWFKFGYPLGYVTDVLLNLEALTEAGVVDDPRLNDAVALMLSKHDDQGRWRMEYSYNGKTWVDIEEKGQPSKWVTLRAMRVLKRLGIEITM